MLWNRFRLWQLCNILPYAGTLRYAMPCPAILAMENFRWMAFFVIIVWQHFSKGWINWTFPFQIHVPMSYSSFFRYFFVLSAGEGTYRTCKSVRSGCLEKSFPCFSVVYIKRNLIFDITVFQCSEFIIFTKLSLCSHIINRVDSFVNFFSSWKELVSLVTDIFLQFINLFCSYLLRSMLVHRKHR